jgi:hypothetical protein
MAEEPAKTWHGCLTAWLILMLVASSATALFYLLGIEAMQQAFPTAPTWLFLANVPRGNFQSGLRHCIVQMEEMGLRIISARQATRPERKLYEEA